MTQATDLKIGDILTADSTWDDSIDGQLFVILAKDGSRRIDDRQWMHQASFPQVAVDRFLGQSDSWLCWGAAGRQIGKPIMFTQGNISLL